MNQSSLKTLLKWWCQIKVRSRSFKVICFDVSEKPLGDYMLRHKFGFIYDISNDIATARHTLI